MPANLSADYLKAEERYRAATTNEERLACLDMDADLMRAVGFEMLWDDAGWSSSPGTPGDKYGDVFTSSYEGPDFAQTLRSLAKSDIQWLLWFCGHPSGSLMDTKAGAWGGPDSDAVSRVVWQRPAQVPQYARMGCQTQGDD